MEAKNRKRISSGVDLEMTYGALERRFIAVFVARDDHGAQDKRRQYYVGRDGTGEHLRSMGGNFTSRYGTMGVHQVAQPGPFGMSYHPTKPYEHDIAGLCDIARPPKLNHPPKRRSNYLEDRLVEDMRSCQVRPKGTDSARRDPRGLTGESTSLTS
jgi:hypothetical protein